MDVAKAAIAAFDRHRTELRCLALRSHRDLVAVDSTTQRAMLCGTVGLTAEERVPLTLQQDSHGVRQANQNSV